MRIRPIDPGDDGEIDLVARRWRDTVVEVLGPERAARELRSHAWICDRVRQHLNRDELTGEVFLAELEGGIIAGHVVMRLEDDERGHPIGLFGTVYVAPEHRRMGIADALLARGERWILDHGRSVGMTYTDKDNAPLHALFGRRGYALRPMPRDFVALSRALR